MKMADTPSQHLPDDASVVLDPAVEILDVEVGEESFLCHTGLNVGMVVPPGEGLLDFVRSLKGTPKRVGALRKEYDDHDLIDRMLSSLLGLGFAHPISGHGPVVMRTALRRAVVIDLDVGAALEDVCAQWNEGETAPEVLVRCTRLSDHTTTLRELADRRAAGILRAHHVVVRALDIRCGAEMIELLARLRASIELDSVEWPAPTDSPPGLADLVQARIDTHVVMAPDASILEERARQCCVEWVRREYVSGLRLRLDSSDFAEKDYGSVFDAVRALEIALGDVVVTNVPGDEVLLGNTHPAWLDGETSDQSRFRLAYLRWRIPLLRALEGDCLWSQTPEVEEKWIRSEEDLLPNHPELLLLAPGRSVVDVCGGLGRVARRLSRVVGPEGVIISIELRRFLTERARRFAYEGNFTNLQFRPGRAERLPVPDEAVDAAVNEWTGAIWELGLGSTMVKEMARVVRPGGRIAVTHRVVQLQLDALDKPWVQYPRIYDWVRDAFRHPELAIIAQRVWGQIVPSKAGLNASLWREQYVPRLVNPDDRIFPKESFDGESLRADVYLTIVAERL